MANELQIRLSADITALTTALNKAKATIKSFESETDKESEKGNVGFKRKIDLIEQLTNKAKALRTALSQATNETQVAKYNAQLEETSRELTRLNALGSSVSSNLGSTTTSFQRAESAIGGTNAVAIEFNRVIQDAPFGLIGIGNNLQQLAGSFANVSQQAGGTGAAIKASLASIISPVNLGLLAISALTAGFTAYQMGAFDGIFATEKLSDTLEKFKESLSAVDSARLEGIGNADKELLTLNSLRGIIESETTSRKSKLDAVKQLQDIYPAYFGNLTQEQILAGDLAKTYEALTKTIIAKAQAEASVGKFVELAQEERLILQKTADERARIAEFEAKALQNEIAGQKELQTINENQARFLKSKIEPQLTRINEIKEEQKTLEGDITSNLIEANAVLTVQKTKVDDINKSYDETIARVEFLNELQKDSSKRFIDLAGNLDTGNQKPIVDVPIEFNLIPEGGQQELGLIQQLQAQIQSINALRDVATDPTRIQAYNEQLKVLQAQLGVLNGVQDGVKLKVEDLSQAFSGLGAVIGKAFNNIGLGQFLGQFIAFAAKLIAANFKIAGSNAIAGASSAAAATGPAAPLTLPAFIAGSLGVVAAAFAAIGGGGKSSSFGGGSGGGGGSSIGRAPQIFTNANTVTPPSPNIPSPSGSIDFDKAQGRLDARVSGEDIVFVYDRYKERQKGGG